MSPLSGAAVVELGYDELKHKLGADGAGLFAPKRLLAGVVCAGAWGYVGAVLPNRPG